MGQFSSGVGLISGLNIADIVDQLVALDGRSKKLVESRKALVTSQQVALQDITAKLTSLNSNLKSLTLPTAFDATAAASSNSDVLGVSSSDATPGSYAFTVDRLVQTQQVITRGFDDLDSSPVGAGTLTFEFGGGKLSVNKALEELNGGLGVKRGKIIISDRSGSSAIVDLSKALTTEDVLNSINQTTGINVVASVVGDRFVLTDNTGSTTADLTVTDIGSGTTAANLGLTTAAVGDVLTGASVNTLGDDVLLADLNDGLGVRTTGGADLEITHGGGTFTVNLSDAETVGELLAAINDAATTAGAAVTATVSDDGTGLKLAGATSVAASNGSKAAEDLGLLTLDGSGNGQRVIGALDSVLVKNLLGGTLGAPDTWNPDKTPGELNENTLLADLRNGAGLPTDPSAHDLVLYTRSGVNYQVELDDLTTVGDMISRINSATSGNVELSIEAGDVFRFTDVSVDNGSQFGIGTSGSLSTVPNVLGVIGYHAGDTVDSVDVDPAKGGLGGVGLGVITITDRTGASEDIDLSNASTVSDIVSAINAAATVNVTASLNSAGHGLLITDNTGATASNLIIADKTGQGASLLNLTADVDDNSVDSGNLQHKYIGESTLLGKLNNGAGITRGRFTITDSSGKSGTVDLTQGNELTVQDVLDEINSRGLAVNARINDNGDGILLEDTGLGTLAIKVEEDGSTTARDLGILGEAEAPGADLDGSFERTLSVGGISELELTTSLDSLNAGDGVADNGVLADFRITARDGSTYDVDLDTASNIQDVIDAINTASGGTVVASIATSGLGLELVDSSTGNETFKIEALNNSEAASDLGILNTDSDGDGTITGLSVVDVLTLERLAERINEADLGVRATVINDGSSSRPYRLSLQSEQAGEAGRFLFDDGGLNMGASTLVEPHDALVFYGSGDPANSIAITSSTNTLKDVIPGATVDLLSVSDTPVTVSITQDDESIVSSVSKFVEGVNSVLNTLDKYDKYDAETEERGLLLGDPTILRVRSAITQLVNSRNSDLSSQYRNLSQVGVRFAEGARLQFDETKFRTALATDRDAVMNMFTFKETETDDDGETTITKAGVGVAFQQIIEGLLDSETGAVQKRIDGMDQQIKLFDDRIESMQELLDLKRARYEAEFYAMERVLADLQGQSSALSGFQPVQINTSSGGGGNSFLGG